MTDEMKARVEEIIEAKAQEAIEQDWIEDTEYLTVFIGWMEEAMNLLGEEGVYDAWEEYDNHDALECYCRYLKDNGAITDWDWDNNYQSVIIKKLEE